MRHAHYRANRQREKRDRQCDRALEQKYGGFTYIFDIGGSYESVLELYGGRVDRIGRDGPRVALFALEPTESNIKFLYSFVKLLLTSGGAEFVTSLDTLVSDEAIHPAVAQKEYARIRRNMIIEYGLMFLDVLDQKTFKASNASPRKET